MSSSRFLFCILFLSMGNTFAAIKKAGHSAASPVLPGILLRTRNVEKLEQRDLKRISIPEVLQNKANSVVLAVLFDENQKPVCHVNTTHHPELLPVMFSPARASFKVQSDIPPCGASEKQEMMLMARDAEQAVSAGPYAVFLGLTAAGLLGNHCNIKLHSESEETYDYDDGFPTVMGLVGGTLFKVFLNAPNAPALITSFVVACGTSVIQYFSQEQLRKIHKN